VDLNESHRFLLISSLVFAFIIDKGLGGVQGHKVKWNPRAEKRREPPRRTVDFSLFFPSLVPSHLFTRGSGDVTHFTRGDNGGWKKATGREGEGPEEALRSTYHGDSVLAPSAGAQ